MAASSIDRPDRGGPADIASARTGAFRTGVFLRFCGLVRPQKRLHIGAAVISAQIFLKCRTKVLVRSEPLRWG